MILQATAEQITQHWDELAPAIEAALPPFAYGAQDRMNNILRALLAGDMQCWTAWAVREGETTPLLVAIMTTAFDFDRCSGVRNLLIYSLYSVAGIGDQVYADGIETLKKFAKTKGCHRVVALVEEPRLVEMWIRGGGEGRFTFLTMEV